MATKKTQLTVIVIPGRAQTFAAKTPADIMADSIRQQIIDALMTRLQTITVVNGYETDLGSNVSEWRTEDWQESELPGANVMDPAESVVVRGGYHEYTLSVELEARVQTAAIARDAIADMIKAIGTDPTFGGLAQHTRPVENESLEFEKKDKLFGGISMKLDIGYFTKAFKPFALA